MRPGHIRVRVHAAGLNRADLIQRRGQYSAPPGWPADIPGMEYAGEVEAVRDVTRWKVGDRVMGLVGGGAQAEFVTVHQDEALAIPSRPLRRRGGGHSGGVPHRLRRAGHPRTAGAGPTAC